MATWNNDVDNEREILIKRVNYSILYQCFQVFNIVNNKWFISLLIWPKFCVKV
jgi:hypothetical protein